MDEKSAKLINYSCTNFKNNKFIKILLNNIQCIMFRTPLVISSPVLITLVLNEIRQCYNFGNS